MMQNFQKILDTIIIATNVISNDGINQSKGKYE